MRSRYDRGNYVLIGLGRQYGMREERTDRLVPRETAGPGGVETPEHFRAEPLPRGFGGPMHGAELGRGRTRPFGGFLRRRHGARSWARVMYFAEGGGTLGAAVRDSAAAALDTVK